MGRGLYIVALSTALVTGIAGCGEGDLADEEVTIEKRQSAMGDPIVGATNGVPVKVRWLGVAGVEFEFDNQIFLVDPYLTRTVNNEPPGGFDWYVYPGKQRSMDPQGLLDGELEPCVQEIDGPQAWAVLEDYLKRLRAPIKHVFASHTHWDHAADIPLLAMQAKKLGMPWGAKIWGPSSMKNLSTAYDTSLLTTGLAASTTPIMPAASGTSLNTGLQNGLPLYQNGQRSVYVTAYLWEHSGTDKLEDDGVYGGMDIDPGRDPRSMKMGHYRQGQMLAFLFRFVDGNKSFTAFVSAASEYQTTTAVTLPYIRQHLNQLGLDGIDALFTTYTDWFGGAGTLPSEEQKSLPAQLTMLRPRYVVPTHFDDYYWPIANTDEVEISNATWLPCSLKKFGETPHLVLPISNNGELEQSFVDIANMAKSLPCNGSPGICPLDTAVIKPKMFGNVFDTSLFELVGAQDAKTCIYDEGGVVKVGSCSRVFGSKLLPWRFERTAGTTGKLRNLASNKCLTGTGPAMGDCATATSWTYTEGAGLLRMTSGTKTYCLYRTSTGVKTTTACSASTASQRWAILTATHIVKADSAGLAFGRQAPLPSSGDVIKPVDWNSSAGVGTDTRSFSYEPRSRYLRLVDDPTSCLFVGNKYPGHDANTVYTYPCSTTDMNYGTKLFDLVAGPAPGQWTINVAGSASCLITNGASIFKDACSGWATSQKLWKLTPSIGIRPATISGSVSSFNGTTHSAVQDAVVTITGCDTTVKTSSSGSYSCQIVPPADGKVTISVSSCPHRPVAPIAKTGVTYGSSVTASFTLVPYTTATVAGRVTFKLGTSTKALAGVTVKVTSGSGALLGTATTDVNGYYAVAGLPINPVAATVSISKPGYTSYSKSVILSCSGGTINATVNATLSLALL